MKRVLASGCFVFFLTAFASSLPAQNGQPANFQLTKEEKVVVDLTNTARVKEELPGYKVNMILTQVARDYAVKMAKQQKLDHFLDGTKVLTRVKEAKYPVHKVGENLGKGEPDCPIPVLFQAWMDSPNHKKNILFKDYTEIGVGMAKDAQGNSWYVQVFARPKENP